MQNSKEFNSKTALNELKELKTVDQVNKFVAPDEDRKTVLDAATKIIKELSGGNDKAPAAKSEDAAPVKKSKGANAGLSLQSVISGLAGIKKPDCVARNGGRNMTVKVKGSPVLKLKIVDPSFFGS